MPNIRKNVVSIIAPVQVQRPSRSAGRRVCHPVHPRARRRTCSSLSRTPSTPAATSWKPKAQPTHHVQLLAWNAKLVFHREPRLAMDRDGRDDQRDQRAELQHDHALAQAARPAGQRQHALQHGDRTEQGQHEGGIRTRGEPDDQPGRDERRAERGIAHVVERDLSLQEAVEAGKSELHGDHRDSQREAGVEEALAQELHDDLSAGCADGLAHADLDGAAGRARRHHAHEIAGRDEEDQRAPMTMNVAAVTRSAGAFMSVGPGRQK